MSTKHETLDLVNKTGKVTKGWLSNACNVSFVYASESINRMVKQGLLRECGISSRCRLYEITDKGIDRLGYFNDDGCKNDRCSCKQ